MATALLIFAALSRRIRSPRRRVAWTATCLATPENLGAMSETVSSTAPSRRVDRAPGQIPSKSLALCAERRGAIERIAHRLALSYDRGSAVSVPREPAEDRRLCEAGAGLGDQSVSR